MPDPSHPLLVAVAPLLERIDAELVAPESMRDSDVPLMWEGSTLAGVRLPDPTDNGRAKAVGDLGLILDDLARDLGGSLADLSRADKQRAVRLLEERGAFSYRKAPEIIAEALGVTRFTVYNYLNRLRS